MASLNTNHGSQQQRLQPHIPKLLYRSTSADDTSSTGSSLSTGLTDRPSLNASTAPSSPRHSDYCPSPTSSRVPSDALAAIGPKSPGLLPPKKRGGSFLRMFTVKEPSSQAFEDYQKQMLKKGASKNGRVAPVGMPGVSSAKLPPTVPKVNSKWDGVPLAVKEREKEKDMARRQSTSGYSRSINSSTSDATHSRSSSRGASQGALDHRQNGKLSFNNSSGNLSDMYGWENRSTSSGNKSPSTNDADFTSFFPCYKQPNPSPSGLTKQSLADLTIPPEHYASPALTPYDSSPPTPSPHPSPRIIVASPHSAQGLKDDIKTTTLEIPPDAEKIIIKSSGVNILGPPASARRKPKPQPFLAGEAQEMQLPSKDVPLRPILKRESKARTIDAVPRPHLPAKALAIESELSKRPNTARERLGLGAMVKGTAIPPWEPSDNTVEGDGQKTKRMSRISRFSK